MKNFENMTMPELKESYYDLQRRYLDTEGSMYLELSSDVCKEMYRRQKPFLVT